MTGATEAQRICPECGAVLSVAAGRCWLCRREMATEGQPPDDEVIVAELAGEPPAYVSKQGWLAAVAIGLAIVTIGVFFVAPGFGVLLLLVEVIGGLVAFGPGRTGKRAESKKEQPSIDQAYASPSAAALEAPAVPPVEASTTNVARQVLMTLGVIFLVMMSCFVAFFVFCWAIMMP